MSERVKWSIVLAKVVPIPILATVIAYLMFLYPLTSVETAVRYGEEMMVGVESQIPMILLIAVCQVIVATALYIIVKFRRGLFLKLSIYFISGVLAFSALLLTTLKVCEILNLPDEVALTLLVVSLALSVPLIKLLLSEKPNVKYITTLIVTALAAACVICYFPPQLTFLLLVLIPIMDTLLVCVGPIGKTIQLVRQSQVLPRNLDTSRAQYISSDRRAERLINPLLKLTVRLDGLLLGIGDFFIYSLATMWSLLVLYSKLSTLALAYVLIVYVPLFVLSFYINIKLCLRRSYGPAAVLPVITCIVTTLLGYYFLTL